MRNNSVRFSQPSGTHRLMAYTTGAKTMAIRISRTSGLRSKAIAIDMVLDTH
jgi:hypothetical protein